MKCIQCKKDIKEKGLWCSMNCKKQFYIDKYSGSYAQSIERELEINRKKRWNSPEIQNFLKRVEEIGFYEALHETKSNKDKSKEK